MFEINDKSYCLEYSMKRLEMIENATGMSVMANLQVNRGMLSVTHLKTFLAYGLKDEGDTTKYINPKKGLELATDLIESQGYINVNMAVIDAIEGNCPFLFQVD